MVEAHNPQEQPFLIVGGTGKTGRRVAERLSANGIKTRLASRRVKTVFDWDDPRSWPAALEGAAAAYITFAPDLAVPGAAERIGSFAKLAVAKGVSRLVLLSGRGEDGALASEEAFRASGADWTILRASWFSQNFSEAFLLDAVRAGVVALPAGRVAEPFIDVDDIAEVAFRVLTEEGNHHTTHELTDPAALTFAEAVAEIAYATGREIHYRQISPAAFGAELESQDVPEAERALLLELFTTVLDGRNALPTSGVEQILGREPLSFAEYARKVAVTGTWKAGTWKAGTWRAGMWKAQ